MAQIYHHIFPKKQQQTDFAEAEEIKFLERAHDGKTSTAYKLFNKNA